MEADTSGSATRRDGEELAGGQQQKLRKRYTLEDISIATAQAGQLGISLAEALTAIQPTLREGVDVPVSSSSEEEADAVGLNAVHKAPKEPPVQVPRQQGVQRGARAVDNVNNSGNQGAVKAPPPQTLQQQRVQFLPSMLAGGSVHVTAAAASATGMREGELEAVRRRLSRLERQTEQLAEASNKCCVRVMANSPPAQFHSNIQAMLDLMDDNMGDIVAFTRTEATAVVIHPRHTTQMGEFRTALQNVIDEFNGQQRLLQLPEVWQVLQQSITKKFLGIPPKLCYEAWRQTVLAISGQPMPYIRTKYPQDNQRAAFALLLEDVVLTSGYIDTDGAVVKLEIKDKAVINGVGLNGRQIQEALQASWRCDYMMDAVVVVGDIKDPFNNESEGKNSRKGRGKSAGGPKGSASDVSKGEARLFGNKGKGKSWEKGKSKGRDQQWQGQGQRMQTQPHQQPLQQQQQQQAAQRQQPQDRLGRQFTPRRGGRGLRGRGQDAPAAAGF